MKHVVCAGCAKDHQGVFTPCLKCREIGADGCSSCAPEVKTAQHESFCGDSGVNLVMLTLTFLLSMQFGVVVGMIHQWLSYGLVGLSYCKP